MVVSTYRVASATPKSSRGQANSAMGTHSSRLTARPSESVGEEFMGLREGQGAACAGPVPGGHLSWRGNSLSIRIHDTCSLVNMCPRRVKDGSPSRVPAGTATVPSPDWPATTRWLPQWLLDHLCGRPKNSTYPCASSSSNPRSPSSVSLSGSRNETRLPSNSCAKVSGSST